MATETDSLILSISADTTQLKRQLGRLQADVRSASKNMENSFAKSGANMARSMQAQMQGISAGFGKLGALAGVGISAQGFIEISDAATRITNSLKVAGVEASAMGATLKQLTAIALQNGASLESLSGLYARVTMNSKELGLSSEQVMTFVERMAQGLRASGTDAQSASAGIKQLTQGLASGVLRGDEFNSVMENLPVVAKAIADGLGVTIGALRKMAEEGELTAGVVFDAFMKGSQGVAEQASKTELTFSQAFENIKTILIEAAGGFNETFKAAKAVQEVVMQLVGAFKQLALAKDEFMKIKWRSDDEIDLKRQIDEANQTIKSNQPTILFDLGKTINESSFGPLFRALGFVSTSMEEQEAIQNRINEVFEKNAVTQSNVAEKTERVTTAIKEQLEPTKKIEEVTGTVTTAMAKLLGLDDERLTKLQQALNLTQQIAGATSGLEDRQETVISNQATEGYVAARELGLKAGDAAVDAFVDRVVQAESGGRADAKNPNSSATGAGQFIDSTWIGMVKDEPEARGKSRQEMLSLRKNMELSRRMIRKYAQHNANVLDNANLDITETNLQLAHFLGEGDAVKVLKAPRGTPLAGLITPASIAANQSILGGGATTNDVLAYAQRRASGSGGGGKSRKEVDQYQEWLKAKKDDIEMAKTENTVRADSTTTLNQQNAYLEEQKFIKEGLAAAARDGTEATAAETAEITKQAHELAQLGLKAAEAEDEKAKYTQQQEDNTAKMEQLAGQLAGVAQGAVSGLIQDLRNGVDAGEAFNNMLNNIIDSLIQMAIQAVFSQDLFKSFLGGGAGGFPAAPAAVGGFAAGGTVTRSGGRRDGRMFPMGAWANAPRMARGGPVFKPGEVPIVAHHGELIIPRSMVNRMKAGGGAGNGSTNVTNNGAINIDMSKTGSVAADDKSGREFGANLQRMIRNEMVKESRPGGLLRGAR